MKLINAKYGVTLELEENQINCLLIESQKAMADMVGDLFRQCQGGEGNFILQDVRLQLM